MLPEGWQIVTLADVANYRAGRTPSRANARFWEGADATLPWVSIADMSQHQLVLDTKEKITPHAAETAFKGRYSPAGTLLMSFKLTIGRVATLGVDAFHNEAIISIFPRQGVNQRYLGYWLSQVDYGRLHDRQIKGNTLNQEKIDRIPVARPSEQEQTDIADVLDEIRTAIALQTNTLDATIALKRAAMRELFTRGLRGEAQKDSEIGPVPENWGIEAIDTHFTVSSGGTPSRSNAKFWKGGHIPWVKTTEVKYNVITETEEHITADGLANSAAKMLPAGTLLMAMYGQGVTRGKVAILGIDAACNQACASMNCRENGEINVRYLYHFLTYRYERIRDLAHGGQQQNLNLDIVRDLPVAFPRDETEQSEVVEILDAIDAKIGLHKLKRAVLEDLFHTLLRKLMTGEIRVADLDLSALQSHQEVAV